MSRTKTFRSGGAITYPNRIMNNNIEAKVIVIASLRNRTRVLKPKNVVRNRPRKYRPTTLPAEFALNRCFRKTTPMYGAHSRC